ncbi:MAG: hypothetical protein IIY44_04035 [Erysipelotrichales bacterium]|nr:hypothetical protein [Erysipelotrichales bacterium]MBQ2310637.1 hypothetical protein [Erysipelotrichales bacterium]
MKKVILRNGVRSNLRARKRTVLFSALIVTLSVLLTLGVGMYTTSLGMLEKCEENYLSVIKLEYLGEDYPSRTVAESFVRDLGKEIDDSYLESIEGVKTWNPTNENIYVSDEYIRTLGTRPMMSYGVYLVSSLFLPQAMRVRIPFEGTPALYGNYYISDETTGNVDIYENGTYAGTVYRCWLDGDYGGSAEEDNPLDDNAPYHYVSKWDPETGEYIVTDAVKKDLPDFCALDTWWETVYMKYGTLYRDNPFIDESYKEYWRDVSGMGYYEERITSYRAYVDQCLFSVKDLTGSMINLNIPVGSDIHPETGVKWLVLCAEEDNSINGLTTLTVQPFEYEKDVLPYHRVESMDDPLLSGGIFLEQAEVYRLYNNYIVHRSAKRIEALHEFQQGDLVLEEGRFPEEGEKGVCVISGSTAARMGKTVGDVIHFEEANFSEWDYYRFQKTGVSKDLKVVGVTARNDEYEGYVWTSDAEKEPSPVLFGYEIGVLEVENAKGEEIAEELTKHLSGEIHVRLLDQGYKNAVEPLQMMRSVGMAVSIASLAGLLSVLALFAFLFITRQKETFDVLRVLGTSARDTRLWFLSGAFAVIAPSAVAGCLIGFLSLGAVMAFAMARVKALYTKNLHFSINLLGVSKDLPISVNFGIPEFLLVLGTVLAAASVLCLVALAGMKSRNKVTKGESKVRPPRQGTSTSGHGALRYIRLSIRRNGLRSLAAPLVTAVLTVLIGVFAMLQNGWDTQIEDLYRNTAIDGSVTSLDGTMVTNLTVSPAIVRQLNASGVAHSVIVSKSVGHYWLEGEMPEFGEGGFAKENREEWIRRRPEVVALNDLRAAPEFYYRDPSVTWAEGYDESALRSDELNVWLHPEALGSAYPALVSKSFLDAHGYEPGQFLTVHCSDYEMITIRIAGTFLKTGDRDNIYIPLAMYYPNAWLSGEEGSLEHYDPRVYGHASLSTVRFTIDPATDLEEFRKTMYEEGFSEPGRIGSVRHTLLLRDAVFTETVGALERFVTITNVLLPMMMAAICVIGFFVSWLLVHGRKNEFALMRGFGLKKGKVFRIFFGEQCILGMTGIVLAFAGLCFAKLVSVRTAILTGIFVLSYMAGTMIAIRTIGKVSLMTLLQEGE